MVPSPDESGLAVRNSTESQTASGNHWPAQLVFYCALVVTACVVLSLTLGDIERSYIVSEALSDLLPAVILLSVGCYAWIRFASTGRISWLASALAFVSYTAMVVAQVVIRVVAEGRPELLLASDWLSSLARIAAAVLLAVSALTPRVTMSAKANSRNGRIALVWLALVAAAIAVSTTLAQHTYTHIAAWQFPAVRAGISGPYWLALASCLLATMIVTRTTLKSSDRTGYLIALWLVPTTLSSGIRLIDTTHPGLVSLLQAQILDIAAAALTATCMSIHSARDHNRAVARLRDLQAMDEISWTLAAAANLRTMLSSLVQVLTRTTDSKLTALYLLNESEDALRLEAVHGEDSHSLQVGASFDITPQPRPGFHSGHTAKALREASLQMVQDVCGDVEFVPWEMVGMYDGWILSAPLISRNRTIGVLNVYLCKEKREVKERSRLLQTMAALVAPAIEGRQASMRMTEEDEQFLAA